MKRFVILALFFVGCQSPTPKPKAQLALKYPIPQYNQISNNCRYTFEHNQLATPKTLSACGITLEYTSLHATLYLTYFDLTKFSLDTLLLDLDKRLTMFGKQAIQVDESAFENKTQNVVGSCITIVGNSPSNVHFFGTDTRKHYLTGSLLFEASPNYDSLAPAIAYIKNDVQRLLETLQWD
ncbi:MAG: gliding motility lipoprotein GldD [Bacteroidetes bacterium]|nr:gliding motility lipoprotein GldD [Bacteroidota bacterium]MDA0888764.1 gliding motility lipoprotein GldD [Bacteroidota bacterium]MDA1084236.1 gliding motility lipoprotein GldD [Bacteroidota bacterium]